MLALILTCVWFRWQPSPAAVTSGAAGELAGSCGRPFVVSGVQATSCGRRVRWSGRVLECMCCTYGLVELVSCMMAGSFGSSGGCMLSLLLGACERAGRCAVRLGQVVCSAYVVRVFVTIMYSALRGVVARAKNVVHE